MVRFWDAKTRHWRRSRQRATGPCQSSISINWQKTLIAMSYWQSNRPSTTINSATPSTFLLPLLLLPLLPTSLSIRTTVALNTALNYLKRRTMAKRRNRTPKPLGITVTVSKKKKEDPLPPPRTPTPPPFHIPDDLYWLEDSDNIANLEATCSWD
jgi:hypothetical protein